MGKIGFKETGRLFVLLILSTVTLDSLWGFVHNSGTAAVINAFLGLVFAAAVVIFSRGVFRNSGLETVFKDVYGKCGTCVLMLIFLVLTIFNAASRMSIFTDAADRYILGDSPRIFILIMFSLCVFGVSFFGMEALTRYSFAGFIIFAVFSVIILISSTGEISYLNICPVLGKGSFLNVANMLYIFSDIVYMYFILNSIKDRKKAENAMLKSVIIAGLITCLFTAFYTLCVPYPVSEEFSYPLYRLAALSNSSVVFQRLDGLVFIIWMFMGFISAGALTLFGIMIFESIFKLNDTAALAAPFSLLVFLLALSGVVSTEFIRESMSVYCFGVIILTTVIYKVKYVWRRKNV